MRPLKLTMTAFGPYAREQVIDFTELNGRNLFLITGATGSGKTTVFDAICYAIYGKASGRDRDGESLRSHFAEDNLLTSVELEFELRGKKYWLRRVPKQTRRKTIGEGHTEQNAQAQLTRLEDPQARLIDGVRNVDEQIIGIMGLSYEQFKQIIMIPQGEFRELLTADSTSREAILQKIFGTEAFKLIQERLGEKAREIKNEVEHLKKQRENSIDNLNTTTHLELAELLAVKPYNSPAIILALESALQKDKDISGQLREELIAVENLLSLKQKEIHTAQVNNQKLQAKDQAEHQKTALESQKPAYELKKTALDKARRALNLILLEDHYKSQTEHFKLKEAEFITAEENEQSAREQLQRAEQVLQQEKEKEPKREELGKKLTLLKESRKKVQDLQSKQNSVKETERNLQTVQKEKDKLEQELVRLKNNIVQNQTRLEESLEASKQFVLVCKEKEKVETLLKKTSDLKSERETLAILVKEADALQTRLQMEENAYRDKERAYDEARSKYLTGLAGVLAEKLERGKPCPVCGADQHPVPACKAEGVLNEQGLKVLETASKASFDKCQNTKIKWEKALAGLDYQNQTVRRLEKELRQLKTEDPQCEEDVSVGMDTNLLELQALLKQLTQDMARLEKLTEQEPFLRKQTKEDNTLLTDNENKLQKLALEEKKLYSQAESLKGVIQSIEENLPSSARSGEDLEQQITKLQKASDLLKQASDQAAESWNQSREAFASAQSDQGNAFKNREEAQKQMVKSLGAFQAALSKAGFTDEGQYLQAKMTEGKIKEMDDEIQSFYESLKSAEDHLNRLIQDVRQLVRVDIHALEGELQHIQHSKLELSDQKTVVVSRMDHNQKMLTGVLKINQTIREQEEKYELVGDLAGSARGFNAQKISFERYVLAAFFHDIIDAANLRLDKMTYGRYQMSRIGEKGKGAAQSGLELEVFDFYTGRARHVKTLSGGESFKASLALALGLADVVQAYAGGISLDTMFVDEGFGTLDPESLDNAIGCLIELQQAGRLVGIISHVPELKASIDARLEVEANKDGSQARFYVN